MIIREINESEYQVTGDSGRTYTVRHVGAGDSEYVNNGATGRLWECDCRTTCKHIEAANTVAALLADQQSVDDISEWTGHGVIAKAEKEVGG